MLLVILLRSCLLPLIFGLGGFLYLSPWVIPTGWVNVLASKCNNAWGLKVCTWGMGLPMPRPPPFAIATLHSSKIQTFVWKVGGIFLYCVNRDSSWDFYSGMTIAPVAQGEALTASDEGSAKNAPVRVRRRNVWSFQKVKKLWLLKWRTELSSLMNAF